MVEPPSSDLSPFKPVTVPDREPPSGGFFIISPSVISGWPHLKTQPVKKLRTLNQDYNYGKRMGRWKHLQPLRPQPLLLIKGQAAVT